MDEREFDTVADAVMARVEQSLENSAAELDFEVMPGGVLEIELDDGSKIIVNKHRAAREVWIAARSGGFHFKYEDGRWIGTRDGVELMQVLARCLSEQAGKPVTL